jgi:hypothetical protein
MCAMAGGSLYIMHRPVNRSPSSAVSVIKANRTIRRQGGHGPPVAHMGLLGDARWATWPQPYRRPREQALTRAARDRWSSRMPKSSGKRQETGTLTT